LAKGSPNVEVEFARENYRRASEDKSWQK